jgi:hypothetical protein
VRCVGAPAPCTAGQICCGGPSGSTCQDPDAGCPGQRLACGGAQDCSASVCCGTAGSTACMAMCTGYHICSMSSECATGESCCPNGGGVPFGGLQHCLALAAGSSCPSPP